MGTTLIISFVALKLKPILRGTFWNMLLWGLDQGPCRTQQLGAGCWWLPWVPFWKQPSPAERSVAQGHALPWGLATIQWLVWADRRLSWPPCLKAHISEGHLSPRGPSSNYKWCFFHAPGANLEGMAPQKLPTQKSLSHSLFLRNPDPRQLIKNYFIFKAFLNILNIDQFLNDFR